MTEYQAHAALVATLELEVSRLRAVNAELRARVESTSLRQRADAWMAVCALLRELRPSWLEGSGSGSAQEQALEAIRAMASQPARQPLSDKQIQDIWCSAKIEGNQHGPFWFARAIERAHGIGDGV